MDSTANPAASQTANALARLQRMLIGALFAGVFAYLSVKFLTKYFETENLTVFAIYCAAAGVLLSLLFLL